MESPILSVIEYRNDLWIGTHKAGLFQLNIKDLKNIEIKKHYTQENGLNSSLAKAFLVDRDSILWFATRKGVTHFNGNDFSFISENDGLIYNVVRSIEQDINGKIWFGTRQGISVLHENKLSNITTDNGLSNGDIFTLKGDKSGNMWIGTIQGGLSKFKNDLFENYLYGNEIVNEFDFEFYDDQNKVVYGKFGGITKSLDNYRHLLPKETENQAITYLFNATEDEIWLCFDQLGIFVINHKTNKLISHKNIENGLLSNTIYTIEKDQFKNIWIGSNNGVNVITANKKNIPIKTRGTFEANAVKDFQEDSLGNMWIATVGGINKIKIKSIEDSFIDIINFSTETGLIIDHIKNILLFNKEELLFGTDGEGFIKYKNGEFTNINVENRLESNNIVSTRRYLHNIWISTNQKIYKTNWIDIDSFLVLKAYDIYDGCLGKESVGNATYIDKDKNLWFGMVDGMIKYNPIADSICLHENHTNINEIKLFFEDVDWKQKGFETSKWRFLPENLILPYDENHLTFQFIGVNFKAPAKTLYQWKLEGLDKSWSPPSPMQEAVYTNIPPGEYTFMVKSSNIDGIWNKEPTAFHFVITAPFYKTWTFIILCAIAIILLLVSIVKMREKNLKERQEELENKIDIATEELQVKNKQITDSIRYAQRIQNAILLTEEEVEKMFPKSFIFFQPKDIVSGDFYWFHEQGNFIYFAAADCTGHGVPGAFMSIVCHNLLEDNTIINPGISPEKLLDLVNISLSKTLRQNENTAIKDGMDICLCRINRTTNQLHYSGANNALYIYSEDGELNEIAADMAPIGSINTKQEINFTVKEINLNEGDTLYLFSDGFVDQFGGKNKKKFKYKRFRQMLFESSKLSPKTQHNYIQDCFTTWKGDFRQIDDILLIGIKI